MTKIRQSNIDDSIITGLTDLNAVPAGGDFVLFYDQSAGTLRKVSRDKFLGSPTVSSVSPTNLTSGDGTGNYTIVITGTDFNSGVTAKLLTSGASEVAFDSLARNSATQLTGVIAKSSLSNANEPYGVLVTNTNGTSNSLTGQINIDAQPVFTTTSGSLGTFSQGSSASVSVNATDPESAGNVTFEIQSGSLPAGMTLVNTAAEGGTAVISGTTPSPGSGTTYNFVLRAVDAASNTSSRAFSIAVSQPTTESFTSSGTFSVPGYVSAIDLLVIAAGGGGGTGGSSTPGSAGGGGGAGGLVFIPSYPVTGSGTVTVTVGCGGAEASISGAQGTIGQDSSFGSPGDPGLGQGGIITAKGGGGGGQGTGAGNPGGSGGGGGGPNSGGTATQPTQPGNSGAYGFGFAGGGGNPSCGNTGGGGGGGAGAVGYTSPHPTSPAQGGSGAAGGAGKAYTIGDGTTSVYYAGGGGGGAGFTGQTNPNPFEDGYNLPGGGGGQGGGGTGARYNCKTPGMTPGADGQANKGGGAGGGGRGSCSQPMSYAGGGGKGVVIVRY